MIKSIYTKIISLYSGDTAQIAEEYKKEFAQEMVKINIRRDKILSIILIVIDCVLILLDTDFFRSMTVVSLPGKNILYIHIILFLVSIAFLYALFFFRRWDINDHVLFYKNLHTLYVSIILIMCSFLSVYGNLVHQHIFPYLTAVFCAASVLYLPPALCLPVYIASNAILAVGLSLTTQFDDRISQTILFSILLTIAAVVVSSINYCAFVRNFINRKIIQQKTEEIDNMNRNLEERLKMQTRELMETSNLLISEINSKHEMEIQIIKSRHLCEEKERILNQTIEYDKLRTIFFANISHELRTPLTLIYSSEQMLDLLLKKGTVHDNRTEIEQYTGIIRQNCYRLIRLIANLIDITKIDAGYFQINPRNCDIVKTIEDITMSVARFIQDKNINLTFDTEIEEKIMAFDPEKMERIMLNLLSNAVKFTPAGGEIYVNIYDRQDKVAVSVKDTGIGIPPEMKDTIFQRFVQVDNTITRNREGSGIGLSLVKSLVEMHNGIINVESDLGKGSEFIIEIPTDIPPSQTCISGSNLTSSQGNFERVSIEFSDIYM